MYVLFVLCMCVCCAYVHMLLILQHTPAGPLSFHVCMCVCMRMLCVFVVYLCTRVYAHAFNLLAHASWTIKSFLVCVCMLVWGGEGVRGCVYS